MTASPLTWDEWQARKRHSEAIARLYPPQLAKMHGEHGSSGTLDRTCGGCAHLRRKAVGAVYFKCGLWDVPSDVLAAVQAQLGEVKR